MKLQNKFQYKFLMSLHVSSVFYRVRSNMFKFNLPHSTPKVDQLESIYSHRLSSLLQATAAAAGGASLSFWNKRFRRMTWLIHE